jgi:hypothetical protein
MRPRSWSNPTEANVRVTPKIRLDVGMHILVLIWVFVPLWLQAQIDTCDAAILAPQAQVPPKPPVCPSPPLPPASPPDNLADATKSALACAWIDGTDHVLEAFRLLTNGPPVTNTNRNVLAALHDASPQNDDLFRAALGNPDKYGEPRVQGLPDFVDTISKAGRRGTVDEKDKVKYQIKLFSCTQFIIDELFKSPKGKTAIAEVNDAFTQKNNYVALYKLLREVWKRDGEPFDADHLEKLRAAFGVSVDNLAKQVAAKITTTSK